LAVKFTKLADTLHPADDEAMQWLLNAEEGDTIEVHVGHRTSKQNNAMHKYFRLLAAALTGAGYDQRTFPWRDGLQIPFTAESVKDLFWHPIQQAMLGKKSTSDLEPKEVNVVYEAVDRAISERTGVHVEFPSMGSLVDER
jgi:hypothetical protein